MSSTVLTYSQFLSVSQNDASSTCGLQAKLQKYICMGQWSGNISMMWSVVFVSALTVISD